MKILFSIFTIISVIIWLILRLLLMPPSLLGYLENWFYWVELLVILDLAWVLNLKSRDILYPVIGLMLAGALFNILGVNELAEVILRISFVGLIVGVIFTLVENYKEPLRRKK